jgi:hypothetical protein
MRKDSDSGGAAAAGAAPPAAPMKDFFISFTRADRHWAEWIVYGRRALSQRPHFAHSSETFDSTLTGTFLTYSSPAAHIASSTTFAISSASAASVSTTISS